MIIFISRGLKAQWLHLPRLQSIVGLMTCTFIIPIALLSLFPHQEPRFIIPVLFPLVFLYAPELSQVPSLDIVRRFNKDDNDNNSGESCDSVVPKRHSRPKKLVFWYISNLLLAFFYAFVHQGGVLPLTSHVAAELKAKPYLTHVHLYTSYSYPLPTALLQLRNTRRVYHSSGSEHKYKYKLTQDFHLYEQGSKPLSRVFDNIARNIRDCEGKFVTKKIPYRFYYALPATAMMEFVELSRNRSHQFSFHLVNTFYPHLSMEKLPSLPSLKKLGDFSILQSDGIFNNCVAAAKSVYRYIKQFRFLLLRIEYLVTSESKRSKPSG